MKTLDISGNRLNHHEKKIINNDENKKNGFFQIWQGLKSVIYRFKDLD